jgi:hypothetical protein
MSVSEVGVLRFPTYDGPKVDLVAELARLPGWTWCEDERRLRRRVRYRGPAEAEQAGTLFVLQAIAAGWRGGVVRSGAELELCLEVREPQLAPRCWAWLGELEALLPSGLLEAEA